MIILRRTERAMVRSMCAVKLVDRKNTEELMKMLGLKETLDKMAKANGVRWYGHVVRRDDESILKKAMIFQVNGPRKRGRPKQTWKKQVEENIKEIGLRVEEATDRARWREGVRAIAEGMRCIPPSSDTRKNRIKTGWLVFCLPSLVNETPRYLNFSDCFSGTPSIWREHCFGCLDRHMVSVFVVLIFIPATEHASENLSRACWRPFWVESSSTRSSANNRRCTVHSPIFTPPQNSLFLTILSL